MPIGLAVDGANPHDQKLLFATLDGIPIRRPRPAHRRQHLCGDLRYDSRPIRQRLARRDYQVHIKSRGQERSEKRIRFAEPI